MKRLLISSLFGCILMSQAQAGSLIPVNQKTAFAAGAFLGAVPLAVITPS